MKPYFIEFVRFRELRKRSFVFEIEPKNRVLTCIAEHFADRFSDGKLGDL